MTTETKKNLIVRPPVVVVLGHIDHGKTTLLDCIRKTHVAKKESGGITQHIGAYQVEKEGKKITFIDTPGHEAFSQMRSRGAKVADIAVLVIDVAEGVKPQTKEAIDHIKKAGVKLIVALNKIDKPSANPEKTKKELSEAGILAESSGGDIPIVLTSASSGQGVEDLLDLILLVAEMESLKSDLSKPVEGLVIESYLDNQRGPTATLLLEEGVLKQGEIIGTPSAFGKVKSLEDFRGNIMEKAFPSDPIIVAGLENVPKVGERFKVFPDIDSAKNNLNICARKTVIAPDIQPDQRVLNLILKSDVVGSVEAIEEVLKDIPQEKVILRMLRCDVGDVNESDVKEAKSGNALILAFRVKVTATAKVISERDKVKISKFDVIYDLVEEVRKLMVKIMEPETVRIDFGKMKVLAIFLNEKNRQIIGGRVTEGEIKKGGQIEVWRNDELVGKGRMINLQKNKKDADKASKGEECGLLYEGNVKVEENDILVFYLEEKRRILS